MAAIEDLYLNPVTGDPELDDDGNLLFVSGQARVAQQARCRLDIQRGAWVRDQTVGLRWLERIFAVGATNEDIRAEVTAELLEVPDLAKVLEIKITRTPSAGVVAIDFTAQTEAGVLVGGQVTA